MTEYVLGEVPDMTPAKKPRVRILAAKVPPFVSKSSIKATDAPYTLADATRHAHMIEEAWRQAGHSVRAEIVKRMSNGRAFYAVRMPDLVNGLPVKKDSN